MGEEEVDLVITGHHSGLITINVAEADHVAREEARVKMGEPYRTLLGHLRHESGHYFWPLLIESTPWIEHFRQHFGDERADYSNALARYYAEGPPANWQQNYISAYASAHPWEDWAETWAHYLHMRDTLETSYDFEVMPENANIPEIAQLPPGNMQGYSLFSALLHDWTKLSILLNGLNRSMGLNDAYPFALSNQAIAKLKFIHQVVCAYYRQPSHKEPGYQSQKGPLDDSGKGSVETTWLVSSATNDSTAGSVTSLTAAASPAGEDMLSSHSKRGI